MFMGEDGVQTDQYCICIISLLTWGVMHAVCLPRATRMTCQTVGPKGDEKNGIRNKWLADCEHHSYKL